VLGKTRYGVRAFRYIPSIHSQSIAPLCTNVSLVVAWNLAGSPPSLWVTYLSVLERLIVFSSHGDEDAEPM
jgi:hypothetical protein